MNFQPVIKWSGSKRNQSEEIIKKFPKDIKTYYEPFVGGGSVLFQLMNSDIKVENYICSDLNEDLINLWHMIMKSPKELCEKYNEFWTELSSISDIEKRKEYYYNVRKRFNMYRKPEDFMFLSRTCANGLIRFNLKGEFNTSFNSARLGIKPSKLEEIVYQWSNLLNEKKVEFICQDYRKINPIEGDLIYLDPPYANIKGMYQGQIDYSVFWDFLLNQKANYILSFDGKTGEKDMTVEIPKKIYDEHHYIYNGISGFGKIHNKQEYIKESLYIKINN